MLFSCDWTWRRCQFTELLAFSLAKCLVRMISSTSWQFCQCLHDALSFQGIQSNYTWYTEWNCLNCRLSTMNSFFNVILFLKVISQTQYGNKFKLKHLGHIAHELMVNKIENYGTFPPYFIDVSHFSVINPLHARICI